MFGFLALEEAVSFSQGLEVTSFVQQIPETVKSLADEELEYMAELVRDLVERCLHAEQPEKRAEPKGFCSRAGVYFSVLPRSHHAEVDVRVAP